MTDLLAGRYELGQTIRNTALTVVRRGWDAQLDREVAITSLRPELTRDDASVGLFAATVAVGAELAHPGLVGVYDAGVSEFENETMRWAAGEVVDAPNVDEFRLPPELAASWLDTVVVLAEQLTDAVQHAHADGAVHGNLGPATVLLETPNPEHDSQPRIRVVGFGPQASDLAVLSDPGLTVRMWQIFTEQLEYPSPEQRAGMAPTRRSDVYGFGCVLAALLLFGENARDSSKSGDASPTEGVERSTPDDQAAADAGGGIGADVSAGAHPSPLGSGEGHPADSAPGLDIAHELRLVAEQAMSLKPADRQHSFVVIRDQLKWIRMARSLNLRDAATSGGVPTATVAGLDVLGAALLSEGSGNADTMVLPSPAAVARATEAPPQTEQLRYLLTRPVPPGTHRAAGTRHRRSRSRGGILFVALLGIIACVVGLGWFVNQSNTQAASAMITIPAVTGKDVSDATSLLGKLGIALGGQVVRADKTIALGLVAGTDPAAGTQIRIDQAVTLVVSGGPDDRAVPQLQGMSLASAQEALASAGLVAGEVSERDGLTAKGVVLDSSPAFGKSVGAGTTVGLVVASGNQRVPAELVGQAGEAAAQALASAGLAPQTVKQPSSEVAPGVVMDVQPGSGSSVPLGSIVTLTVAVWAPPAAPNVPEPNPATTPSPTAKPTVAATPKPTTTPSQRPDE